MDYEVPTGGPKLAESSSIHSKRNGAMVDVGLLLVLVLVFGLVFCVRDGVVLLIRNTHVDCTCVELV